MLRAVTAADLPAVNAVISAAVMGWNLPERVKRLSLPSYFYTAHELDLMALWVAEETGRGIVGVAAWEEADSRDTPAGKTGLLLHGLYVEPECQGRGVGTALLNAALEAAREGGYDGLLVKAHVDAGGFFAKQQLSSLPVKDPARDYPHRWWKTVRG